MIKKLRIKILIILMLIISALLGVIFGMILHFTGRSMEKDNLAMLQEIREHQGRPEHEDGPGHDGPPDFDKHPPEHENAPPDHDFLMERQPYIHVTMDEKGTVGEIHNNLMSDMDSDEIAESVRIGFERETDNGIIWQYRLMYQRSDEPSGRNITFLDVSDEFAMLIQLTNNLTATGAISLIFSFAISWFLSGWAVKPVARAWDQQRQFVADASHELKTPLTVINTNAELLLEETRAQEEKLRFTENILTMSHQMRGLVEGLLNLARIDSGALNMDFQNLDLSDLVESELLPYEPVIFENGLELETEITPGLRIHGSERHLRQVLGILLDNACKYSHKPGTVRVLLKQQGCSCVLTVSNPGEDLSKEQLKNIFTRFYRVDEARTLSQSYGLGLSIARSFVQEHKGKIWAESSEGIIRFCVQLPLRRHSTK